MNGSTDLFHLLINGGKLGWHHPLFRSPLILTFWDILVGSFPLRGAVSWREKSCLLIFKGVPPPWRQQGIFCRIAIECYWQFRGAWGFLWQQIHVQSICLQPIPSSSAPSLVSSAKNQQPASRASPIPGSQFPAPGGGSANAKNAPLLNECFVFADRSCYSSWSKISWEFVDILSR